MWVFSSADSQGLCSVCYKKSLHKDNTPAVQSNHSNTSHRDIEQHTAVSEGIHTHHEVPSEVTRQVNDTPKMFLDRF